ncbi:hypothetical protein M427DRAFT_59133 [Gonapodya prolifera JEL478]|uniref:Translation initiation factor 3 N-terminal domain-containing protein n=1 Tax=Gonapodya prolifera (strain JEL478) TaxID=1344416 RepID=A0A139A7Y6_GONPJ|nr:hypothetical protein M427DRAFT_59133 [Gonapodya prolifera JEL478]|eukprot:KXS12809.1 hypothetical protein M427DRAFT_59133 [Gonapodya prolifera JEL478]
MTLLGIVRRSFGATFSRYSTSASRSLSSIQSHRILNNCTLNPTSRTKSYLIQRTVVHQNLSRSISGQRSFPVNLEIAPFLRKRLSDTTPSTSTLPSALVVNLIAETGARVGEVPLDEALNAAQSKGPEFELVLVNAESVPPICRIRPLKRTTSELQKAAAQKGGGQSTENSAGASNQESSSGTDWKQPKPEKAAREPKELEVGTGISPRDLEIKLGRARGWIERDLRVIVKVKDKHKGMPGGGAANQEKVIRHILQELSSVGTHVGQLRREGLKTVAEIRPKKK